MVMLGNVSENLICSENREGFWASRNKWYQGKKNNTCESNSLYCVYYLLLAEPETERGEEVYRRKRLIDYREKTLLFSAPVP